MLDVNRGVIMFCIQYLVSLTLTYLLLVGTKKFGMCVFSFLLFVKIDSYYQITVINIRWRLHFHVF